MNLPSVNLLVLSHAESLARYHQWFHERPRAMRALSWAEAGPSWSWLSARHPVTLANRARVEYHAVVADILLTAATVAPPETPSAPVDLFGRVNRSSLKLRGS